MPSTRPSGPQSLGSPGGSDNNITVRLHPVPGNLAETSQTLITVYDSFQDFFLRLWPRLKGLNPKDEAKEFLEILWIYTQSYGHYLHHTVGGVKNALRLKATIAITLNTAHPQCRDLVKVLGLILDTARQVLVPAQEFNKHLLRVESAIQEVVAMISNQGPSILQENSESANPDSVVPASTAERASSDTTLELAIPGVESSEVFYLLFASIERAQGPDGLVKNAGKSSLLTEIFKQHQLLQDDGSGFINDSEAGALLYRLARRMLELGLSRVELLSHIALAKAAKHEGRALLKGEEDGQFLELLGAEEEGVLKFKLLLDELVRDIGKNPDFFDFATKIAASLGEEIDLGTYRSYGERGLIEALTTAQRYMLEGILECIDPVDMLPPSSSALKLSLPLPRDLPPALSLQRAASRAPHFLSPERAIGLCQIAVVAALFVALNAERPSQSPKSTRRHLSPVDGPAEASLDPEPDAAIADALAPDASIEVPPPEESLPSSATIISRKYFGQDIIDHKKSLTILRAQGWESVTLVQNKYGPGVFSLELVNKDGQKALIRDRRIESGQTEVPIEPLH